MSSFLATPTGFLAQWDKGIHEHTITNTYISSNCNALLDFAIVTPKKRTTHADELF